MSDLCQVLGPVEITGVRCGWAPGNETRASLNQPKTLSTLSGRRQSWHTG